MNNHPILCPPTPFPLTHISFLPSIKATGVSFRMLSSGPPWKLINLINVVLFSSWRKWRYIAECTVFRPLCTLVPYHARKMHPSNPFRKEMMLGALEVPYHCHFTHTLYPSSTSIGSLSCNVVRGKSYPLL